MNSHAPRPGHDGGWVFWNKHLHPERYDQRYAEASWLKDSGNTAFSQWLQEAECRCLMPAFKLVRKVNLAAEILLCHDGLMVDKNTPVNEEMLAAAVRKEGFAMTFVQKPLR